MFSSQVFKRCLIPSLAAVAVDIKTSEQPQVKEDHLCRPSELPLYTKEPPITLPTLDENEQLNKFEESIRTIRLQLVEFNKEYQSYKKVGIQELNKRKEDLDWVVNYLQEEDNTLPKVGAIGIGAITGLIFGLRGGFIKKTLYATVGALGIGAICYPKEASEYGQIGFVEGKKYLTVAYNFVNGVKKDDPPKDLPSLPTLPSNFSEIWGSVKSTATSFLSLEKSEPEKTTKSE